MQYLNHYNSPLGKIFMTADEAGLTGLWFDGQRYSENYGSRCDESELEVFADTKRWLDIYFSGKEPDFSVPIHFKGTEFQCDVWEILCSVPYGRTVTYGLIARQIAEKRGISRMSAQAVGGAVGKNKISIIVPCHRVVGEKGLTGYAGGLDRKLSLLNLEGAEIKCKA